MQEKGFPQSRESVFPALHYEQHQECGASITCSTMKSGARSPVQKIIGLVLCIYKDVGIQRYCKSPFTVSMY